MNGWINVPADESVAKKMLNSRLHPLLIVNEVKGCPDIALTTHSYCCSELLFGSVTPSHLGGQELSESFNDMTSKLN